MDFLNGVTLNSSLSTLVPCLLIVGYIFAQTPKFPDWAIPWALMVISILAGGLCLGWNYEGLANGIIAAGMAVFSHQVYKQSTTRDSGIAPAPAAPEASSTPAMEALKEATVAPVENTTSN